MKIIQTHLLVRLKSKVNKINPSRVSFNISHQVIWIAITITTYVISYSVIFVIDFILIAEAVIDHRLI